MKHFINFTLLLLLFSSLHADTITKPKPLPFVFSGVVKNNNNFQLLLDFTQYVSKKSNIPLQTAYVNSYANLSKILKEHPRSLAWTCAAPFMLAYKKGEEKLIAVPLFKGKPLYNSVIITQKKNTQACIKDFKGAIFAYSDPLSNSGFLAPKYHLAKSNIKISNFFSLMLNTGSHEGSIASVISGIADIAAVDEYILDLYLIKHPEAKNILREVKRLGPFPFTPIVAGKDISAQEIKTLASVLTQMKNDPEGKKLLDTFALNGFVIKSPEFYKPIEKMIDTVGLDNPNSSN